ncbi:MAG TPA: serine hydrolase [Longimicrobium sp.]|nr:serine hydrolase [Longimicrobium sp.]
MKRLAPLALLLAAACAAPRGPSTTLGPRSTASSRLAALEAEVREIVRRGAGDTAEVAVAYLDLETGDSLLVGAHTVMHAASTMKVPVMLELFRRAEAGALRLDDSVEVRNEFRSILDGSPYALSAADDSDTTLYARVGRRVPIRELVERMITRSSNLATNLVIGLADPKRIERTLAELGASEMRVLRGVEDGPAFRAGMNNTTTAYGFAKVLEAIAAGRGASAEGSREMVAILGRQEFTEMIPAGLPPGTRAANKTGSITRIAHDGAIVFPEGRAPYVLVVLTRGFTSPAAAAPTGRAVSAAVWRHAAGRAGR